MVEKAKSAVVAGAGSRAAIACRSCRQRKVKCDAQSVPSQEGCGPCRRAGKECLLDPLSDGRRSVNRKCVDRLQQRIEMLEAQNQRLGDPSRWILSEDGSESDHSAQNHASVLPYGPRNIQSTVIKDTLPCHPPPSFGNGCVEQAPTSADGSSPGYTSSHSSPSFYGATCHPHVVSSMDEPQPCFQELDSIGIGIDLDPNSPNLRSHLFQSFFKYQTLWVDVVDKESFLSHQASGSYQSRWCSRFLENAMLACGTRLSTSKSVRALGPKYCEWAKDDVLKAMSDPTPANLQGFLLLSEYEVTQGNDRPAWMYCGVACRMSSDLGLHELASIADCPNDSQDSGKESNLAYALLSACVVYEGVWTLYLGRPSSIPQCVINIVNSRCQQHRKADTPWLNAWVGLCVPMAEITRILNDKSTIDTERLSALRSLSMQVEDWYKSLPPELVYTKDRLINMHMAGYGLHSQYCKVQILLQRALVQQPNHRKRRYSQMTANEGGCEVEVGGESGTCAQTPPNASDTVVYQYALRVARLIVTYREAFGMEHIPSIMLDNAVVAATAMIQHYNTGAGPGDLDDSIWLRQLLKSMESMQQHFPIITRMLESLKQISGSGPLMSMLSVTRWGSTEASILEQPRGIGSTTNTNDSRNNDSIGNKGNNSNGDNTTKNNDAGSNIQYTTIAEMGNGPEILWDCFDNDIVPGIGVFPSASFGDFVLDMHPTEALGSAIS